MTASLSGEPLGACVSSPLDAALLSDSCFAAEFSASCENTPVSGASSGGSSRPSSPLPPSGGSPFYRSVLSPLCDRICMHLVPPAVSPDVISFLALCCAGSATLFCCYADGEFASLPVGDRKGGIPQDPAAVTTSLYEAGQRNTSAWWAVAGVLWMLYSVLDNVDGKQARRLRRCTAGGDFLDHSSDSIVTSLSGLVAMKTLLLRPAFLPPSQPSLLFSLPLTEGNASRMISLGQADCFAFIMISQLPFFIATWAHPIVGRTILSSSLDGVDWFSVDEVNFIVIPSILFVRAFLPWFWPTSLLSLLSVLPVSLHPVVTSLASVVGGLFQLPPTGVTLGVLVIFASCVLSVVESSRLLFKLIRWHHVPRLLPGMVLFSGSLIFKPPVLLQLGVFSLLCLELIAARLKLHVRTQLYMWWPVALYYLFLVTLRGSPQASTPLGTFPSFIPLSNEVVKSFVASHYTYNGAAAGTLALLTICLLSYKHIINRRNNYMQSGKTE
ncbi:cdp-alcohol phosphatidyltransferase [Cystoisospora suis]|uniref:Cdp-alcohol phosphatidyltransferase n=1 Tax=Cystoisospora suis TaxID=483139 RepID=A0A2C6KUW7_9APIC|nr:cdp-alcohol phosphatidyltransferase [Cystoisospora suis]